MNKNSMGMWKRIVKGARSSVLVTVFSILIGGMLGAIGVAIFTPTYAYPSIEVFILSYLAYGVLFTICLVVIILAVLAITLK